MRRASGLAAACLLLLVGASAPAQTSEIQDRDDPFRPYREYFTGQIRAGAYPNLLGLRLSGRIDRASGRLITLLEVEFAYMSDHKRGYEGARNSRAEALRLTVVSSSGRCRTGSSCPYGERFSVEVPEPELRQAPVQGYQLELFARNGPDALVTIPKAAIVRLLERIDRERAPPAAAKPAKAAVR
jgi:hypothetical protein